MSNRFFLDASELLVQYARRHRDQRNIATHMIGVPMIVFGLGVLLARTTFGGAESLLTPAWLAWGLATLWYVSRGHVLLGVAVSLANAVLFALAHLAAGGSVAAWLTWGLGFVALGWAFQYIGHYYEGKRPAFSGEPLGLLVAPMFVAAELLFALGLERSLHDEVERRAGPPVLRDLAHPVA